MTTFNDLISELASENLLDEINLRGYGEPAGDGGSVVGGASEDPAVPTPDLLSLSENYELKLPDFGILKPEVDPYFDENQVKNIFPTQEPAITMQNTQNLIKYQTRRRVKTRSKAKRHCRTCRVKVSAFSFNCKNCHARIVSDLYYYSVVGLGFTVFTILVWLIVTSKTYK